MGGKNYVTPYVGVWIETKISREGMERMKSLLMWECGLKQFFALLASMAVERSLLMWECGLKLFELDPENRKYSHSLCGSVD